MIFQNIISQFAIYFCTWETVADLNILARVAALLMTALTIWDSRWQKWSTVLFIIKRSILMPLSVNYKKNNLKKHVFFTFHTGSLFSIHLCIQSQIQFISSQLLSPQHWDLLKWKALTVRVTLQTIHTAHICIHAALTSIGKSIEIYITISLANPHASRPVNDAGRVIQTVFTE